MAYVMILITCLLIGILAQAVKGLPGAKWAAITATILLPTWFCCSVAATMTRASLFAQAAESYALVGLVCGVVGVLMALIMATLPTPISVRAGRHDIAPLGPRASRSVPGRVPRKASPFPPWR